MRGLESSQQQLFSYISLEERIPANHSLRPLKVLVDGILKGMDRQFDVVYSQEGRPSIPPERLLRASLLQVLFTIRSERQLVEHIEYNLLYRWFVGLDIDEAVWDHSTFTQNRDRLLDKEMAGHFLRESRNWHRGRHLAVMSISALTAPCWMHGHRTKVSCAKTETAIRRMTILVTQVVTSKEKSAAMPPMNRLLIRVPAWRARVTVMPAVSATWAMY